MTKTNAVDMHCDTILRLVDDNGDLYSNEGQLDIKRMKESGYLLQCFAMFIDLKRYDKPLERTLQMIDKYYQEMEKNVSYIRPVFSYSDIEENMRNKIMSAMLTIEDGGVTQGNLSFLRILYLLGVRMITLTWNYENGIGYPSFQTIDGKPDFKKPETGKGLTKEGIAFVKEMERLGMIIDVSHLSDKGFYDVYENTSKPFVASHSNSRSECLSTRNMTDDMIKKLASRGGVLGINYCTSFVNEDGKYSHVKDLIKHIKHIKELVGIDYVGLGSDFDGIGNNLELNSCDKLPLLQEEMRKSGFTDDEIEKVFYKNTLRVFKEVLL